MQINVKALDQFVQELDSPESLLVKKKNLHVKLCAENPLSSVLHLLK